MGPGSGSSARFPLQTIVLWLFISASAGIRAWPQDEDHHKTSFSWGPMNMTGNLVPVKQVLQPDGRLRQGNTLPVCYIVAMQKATMWVKDNGRAKAKPSPREQPCVEVLLHTHNFLLSMISLWEK